MSILIAAICVLAAIAVCAWTWLEGCRARKRIAQATIRELAPGHPAGRGIRPEDPYLRVPLSDGERRTFDAITERRRVLVGIPHGSPMNVSAGAAGEVALAGAHERPAGIGVPPAEAPPLAGRKEGTGAPGTFGGFVSGGLPCHRTPRASDESRTGHE